MDGDDIKLLFEKFDVRANSKILESSDDAKHRRFKDKWLLVITSILLYFIFILLSIFILLNPNNGHVGLAINALTGIGMGVFGYYMRGKN